MPTYKRLPIENSDNGTWGNVLNSYLAHITPVNKGGINYWTTAGRPIYKPYQANRPDSPSNIALDADDEGLMGINTTLNAIERWSGSAWATISGAAGSVGQIQFSGSTTDRSFSASSNLVWDNSNNRLGVGTTPSYTLHVSGSVTSDGGYLTHFDAGSPASTINEASALHAKVIVTGYDARTATSEGHVGYYFAGDGGSNNNFDLFPRGLFGKVTLSATNTTYSDAPTGAYGWVTHSNGSAQTIGDGPTFAHDEFVNGVHGYVDAAWNVNGSIHASSRYFIAGVMGRAVTSGTATSYGGVFISEGTATTQIGLYAKASGGTNNYAAIFNGGNVGINTTTPTSLFSVGSSSQFQVDSSGNIVKLNNVLTSFPSSQGAIDTYLKNNGSGTLTWSTVTPAAAGSNTHIQYNSSGSLAGTANFTWDNTNVRLGIGQANPVTRFEILQPGHAATLTSYDATTINFSSLSASATHVTQLNLHDTATAAADVGGGIGFGGKFNTTGGSTNQVTTWAGIFGKKTNSTDGNSSGYLAFYTRTSGSSWTEKMRIDNAGNVGIGTSPGSKLDVNGDTSITGNLTLSGTSRRIIADFSNATHSSRTLIQSSTTNGNTILGIIPNGTATVGQLNVYGDSSATSTSLGAFRSIGSTNADIASGATTQYITISPGTTERFRVTIDGPVLSAVTPTAQGGIGYDSTNKSLLVHDGTASRSIDVSGWRTYTPTLTGVSSTSLASARYHITGKKVTVVYNVSGTSNATTFTVSLPVTANNVKAEYAVRVTDNGTISTTPGMAEITGSATAIDIRKDWAGAAFTASGTKAANGVVVYESA